MMMMMAVGVEVMMVVVEVACLTCRACLELDDFLEAISPDDLADELENGQPRFIYYCFEYTRADGRLTSPVQFIWCAHSQRMPHHVTILFAHPAVVTGKTCCLSWPGARWAAKLTGETAIAL